MPLSEIASLANAWSGDAGGLHRHAVWNVIGVAVYLAYGRVKSRLA
jgi:hypothetical protein